MRGDLSVVGQQFTVERNVAASATRFESGEPLHQPSASYSSGVCSSNVYVLAAADTSVIGTDHFGGVAQSGALPFKTGTLVAQTAVAMCPIPNSGYLRGKAETAANIDTAAELLAIINDLVLIDYNATGGTDGGELYTIKDAASADTSAFTITKGDTFKGTLDVTVDARAYRNDVS